VKFNLVYTQRASRDVGNLERHIRLRIAKSLLRFQEDPLKYAEKISDSKLGSYRFRIGDYRVIFDIECIICLSPFAIHHEKHEGLGR
jgi:mRNA interferase RelE/StbE